jgi:hypothetical protein
MIFSHVGLISNIRGNNFTNIVASQHIARRYVSRCMSLVLVGVQISSRHYWMILNLHTSVRCLGNMLVLSLALFLCSVFTDPGTSENFLGTSEFIFLCGSRLSDFGTSRL